MPDGGAGLLAPWPSQVAQARGKLHRLPGGEPVLVPGDEGVVRGRVVSLPRAGVLEMLDLLYGASRKRRRVVVALKDGREVSAWAWVTDSGAARRGRLPALRTDDWRRLGHASLRGVWEVDGKDEVP